MTWTCRAPRGLHGRTCRHQVGDHHGPHFGRVGLVALAIAGHPRFAVSDLELRREVVAAHLKGRQLLSPQARKTTFFMYSQLGGTLPAPLFLFLAGISFAMVTDKLRQKGFPPGQIAKSTIRRGDRESS